MRTTHFLSAFFLAHSLESRTNKLISRQFCVEKPAAKTGRKDLLPASTKKINQQIYYSLFFRSMKWYNHASQISPQIKCIILSDQYNFYD